MIAKSIVLLTNLLYITKFAISAAGPTDCDLNYFSYANPNILNETIYKSNELLTKQCIANVRNSGENPANIVTFTCEELICGTECIITNIGNVS